MGNLPWDTPQNITPWTSAQKSRMDREAEELRRERTEGRSDDSVAEGVEALKRLIEARCGMIVQMRWNLYDRGKMKVLTANPADKSDKDGMNGQFNARSPREATLIMLDSRGLHYVAPDFPDRRHCPGHWKRLPENVFPDIVRAFQLFPDDLEEIIKLLSLD